MVLTFTLIRPLLWLISRLTPTSSGLRHGVKTLGQLGSVWSGKRALVGLSPSMSAQIPASWGIKEGIFPISNPDRAGELDDQTALRSVWYYVTHQGIGLDVALILEGFRSHRAESSDSASDSSLN